MGDRTNAERQRRYIARLKARAVEGVTSAPDTAEVAALAQKLAQAEQQLAAAKARILNLEDEIAALRGALAHERKRHAAKPKAEKPPSSRTRGACKPGETRLHPSARPIAGVIVKPL
jgi:predicted  nucleic acid-binding Zn-ribbon protein